MFAALDWYAVGRRCKTVEYVAKPAALALLLLYAAAHPEASWALLAALMFSLLGDVYLMLPVDMFLFGLAAFLVGHIAYVVAIDADLTSRVLWVALIFLMSAPVAYRILRAVRPTSMRPAVALYMLAIVAMVASAVAAGNVVAIAGALLFYASDAMIAWDRFVQPFSLARLGIIVTYHLGQLGLVWGLT